MKLSGLLKIDTNYQSRVYGLDVFRAVAILLVVFSHGGFIIDGFLPGFPYIKLIDGVELFFVLSGFLIGTILIKNYESEDKPDLNSVFTFWKRRWFRTLPNYYLVLLLNVIFVYFGIIHGKIENFNWKFLFFLQNFYSYFTDFFWESWSLTVEEWFYIIIPVSILIFHYLFQSKVSKKYLMLFVVLFFILLPLFHRINISAVETDPFWYDVKFRKVILTRLDAIMYGVLFAWIKFYLLSLWKKIAIPFFITGLAIIYTVMYAASLDPVGFYAKTIYFSIVGGASAMLLPLADSIKSFKTGFGKIMTHISLISYSMYLINLSLVAQVIEKNFYPDPGINSLFTYVIYWSIVIVISTLMYKYFEKPIMDLRDKK